MEAGLRVVAYPGIDCGVSGGSVTNVSGSGNSMDEHESEAYSSKESLCQSVPFVSTNTDAR